MHLINFAHPITNAQLAQIEILTGQPFARVIHAPVQFDHAIPFTEQARYAVASIELNSSQWQALPLLINLPALSVIASLVLAKIHGRTGYFPAVLRLRPVNESMPPQFEVAEILNLQQVRDAARIKR